MQLKTFKRGVHPPDQKGRTNAKKIVEIAPEVGQMMIFPMSQHIGAPAKPVVSVGDYVKAGQLLGDTEAFVSSPVHSSVSGVVKEIRPVLIPNGITVTSVIVENDGKYEMAPPLGYNEGDSIPSSFPYENLPREEVLRLVRSAGVVGLGGAGFPTHVKLSPSADKKIEHFIVNAAECEPYLTLDHRAMLERTDDFKDGIKIVLGLFPEANCMIGIETNKKDAMEHLEKAFSDMKGKVTIVPLVPKYPQGAEKQLIYACTGREVPTGGLPADVGCIVNNVDTVIAICGAVKYRRPLMRRVLTITGGCVKEPGNFEVLLGVSYRWLVEKTGGFTEEPRKLISGGPMMGAAMFDLDVPVIKTSSALIAMTEKECVTPQERNCIHCGRCSEHCPINLLPAHLNYFAINSDLDGFAKHYGKDCIECGCCSYICPAKRHLTQSIRTARRALMARK